MFTTLIASAAFATTVSALGQAIVNNHCSYPVYLQNTPASGGGYSTISQTLQSGGSYSQAWTQLSNAQGWSLKLSQSESLANIMQYEYTFHDDGIIWYDLSDVDGNPWDGNWEITASGSCTPKQQAYRYSTDDAYGMQACPDDSSITVTLCSGTNGGAGEPPSSPAPTTAAPAPAPTHTKRPHHQPQTTWALNNHNVVAAPAGDAVVDSSTQQQAAAPSPTTLATVASAADPYKVTVTQVQTAVVTQYVTATAAAVKRHEHHRRHAHHNHA